MIFEKGLIKFILNNIFEFDNNSFNFKKYFKVNVLQYKYMFIYKS